MFYNIENNKNCTNCHISSPHNHHRDNEVLRYLNFTALFEHFMITTTTTAKTAINADLPFPPIAMIARRI